MRNKIAIRENTEQQEDRLLAQVIEAGNVDVLEKFLALREREESRRAALEFDRHFAAMQEEFQGTSAKKTKTGYGYQYAPLEELQQQYGTIIARHGFSYCWREETLEAGKRCVMRISGWGHSRENSFDVPPLDGTERMNPIQAMGAMSTYGRRYTFIAGFGVVILDEDTDASEYAEQIATIQSCKNMTELSTQWKRIFQTVRGNPAGLAHLTRAKDARKRELSK